MQPTLCHTTPTQLSTVLVLAAIEFVEGETLAHMIQVMHVSQLTQRLHFSICRSLKNQYRCNTSFGTLGHITDWLSQKATFTSYVPVRNQYHSQLPFGDSLDNDTCSASDAAELAVIHCQSPFDSRRPNHTKLCIALQCKSHLSFIKLVHMTTFIVLHSNSATYG